MMPADFCPFCPGGEWDTPNEVYAVRDPGTAPDGPGWRLRVVPNKFPAVRPDAERGYGFHEVLIDTPRHVTDPADLTPAETLAGLVAVRERVAALCARPGVRHVAVFRNVGAAAGASLAHTHAQILATPFEPADGAADRADGCAVCRLVEAGERVVATVPGVVALCPPAGRFDHEVWLLPARHADLVAATDAELAAVAASLRRVRRAVGAALGRPAYNEIVRTAPGRHWRVELIPRTATLAGFELGTGCHILTVTPERSAERLRAALPPEDV